MRRPGKSFRFFPKKSFFAQPPDNIRQFQPPHMANNGCGRPDRPDWDNCIDSTSDASADFPHVGTSNPSRKKVLLL
jgi:hypothetical protein